VPDFSSIFNKLKGKIIVSCQPSPGDPLDPLDHLDTLTRIAASVLRGGAGGLRAEGPERIAAFRTLTDLPIIGITKSFDINGEVYITPDFASAEAVSRAGADIVSLDCTLRRLTELEPWPTLIPLIHNNLSRPVLADIATLDDALAAADAGADAVATTLSGYTQNSPEKRVNYPLLTQLTKKLNIPVILEGHVTHPSEVRTAFDIGVHAVVIGSAITRPQTITARFVEAARG
jgi:N-acylglucosamine-6-phosphate 2-epimerase